MKNKLRLTCLAILCVLAAACATKKTCDVPAPSISFYIEDNQGKLLDSAALSTIEVLVGNKLLDSRIYTIRAPDKDKPNKLKIISSYLWFTMPGKDMEYMGTFKLKTPSKDYVLDLAFSRFAEPFCSGYTVTKIIFDNKVISSDKDKIACKGICTITLD